MLQRFAGNEFQGHGYFLARKFLVLGPVALARSFLFIACFASVIFLIPSSTHAYTSPGRPTGYVNDFANVIPATDRQLLETKLVALKSQTGDEVVVATVPSLGDETIESYAVDLLKEWGIGQKGNDNGLLILVAPSERQARIEVGYGLEGDVTDLQSGNIIRKVMIPAFKANDYAGGITGAVDAVSAIILNSPDAAQYSDASSGSSGSVDWGNLFPVVIVLVITVLNVFARVLGRTKSWWLGGVIGAIVGVIAGLAWGFIPIGIGAIIILTIFGLLFDYIVSKHPPGPGGRGGIWPIFLGGGRGGSSGGFGGFGGGSSGGGGASGSW